MKKLLELTKGNRLLYITAILSIAAATFISMIEPIIIKVTIDSILAIIP
jgi:ATP-binding cassette subfamily B protein